MLPSCQDKYGELRERHRQKKRIKHTILKTMSVAVVSIVTVTYFLPKISSSATESDSISNDFTHSLDHDSSRSLLNDGYPKDAFTTEEIEQGAWIMYLLGMMYTFIAIALVCDEWFVPAIEEIVEVLDMSPDTAGATWMAAGGSAPELFTNIISVFISQSDGSDMGFGTIVGSAVFNVLFVIGCCAIATPGNLKLTWWPFARDCLYYIVGLGVLAGFYSDNLIKWWESLILLFLYVGYASFMTQNQKLRNLVEGKLQNMREGKKGKSTTTTSTNMALGNNMVATLNKDGTGFTVDFKMPPKSGGNPTSDAQTVGGNEMVLKPHEGIFAQLNQQRLNKEAADAQHGNNSDSGHGDDKVNEVKSHQSAGSELSPKSRLSGVHFRASFYDFLTKDSSMAEQMGVHVVARMKGETEETFRAIDTDRNGHIDKNELKEVLLSLGEHVTVDDVQIVFSQIDKNGDGKISFIEFQDWYLNSQLRMTSEIKGIFEQFDTNDDLRIDCHELRKLLETMNAGQGQISDEELKKAMEEMNKTMNDKISEDEFVQWYSGTQYYEQKALKRQETLSKMKEDEEDGDGIEIEWPEKVIPRIWVVVTAPIMLSLYYTLPDVQKSSKKHLWPLTFIGSMLWLMFYSYLMVWWATRVGQGWKLNETLMGLTFVAAGTSVPDLLSSVIVAKQGQGDMAVSSSIGSNIFDILIGLPGPWLFYALIIGDGSYEGEAGSLFTSLVVLMIMLVAVLISIIANGWKLSHRLGWCMFVLYVIFVCHQVLSEESCCSFLAFLD